jgi:replication initiation protein RepC
MSTAYTQYEWHIQDSHINHFGSEGQGFHTGDTTQDQGPAKAKNVQVVSLRLVLSICKEHQSFSPESLGDWSDLTRISDKIVPMLGIDQPVLIEASRIMGGGGSDSYCAMYARER